MTVPVYTFDIDVRCIKMVQRTDGMAERFTGADRVIHLTPFLGDAGAVRTSKALHQPAGAFEISFGDRLDEGALDSTYARIEPMDMIEIRASRYPEQYVGRDLPLIMRGFVDAVRRTESIADDERPRRAVVITGHDFGKLWLIHQVFWELASAQEKQMLTRFGLQVQLGLKPEALGIGAFLKIFTEKVMNERIAEMSAFAQQAVSPFIPDTSGVQDGMVLPAIVGDISAGTYWTIIGTFADRPWNELFVRDEEDGPHLVFRETPYKDLGGQLIMPHATDPGTVEADIAEVVQWDVSRSDMRVANFYWTPPGSSSVITNQYAVTGAIVDQSALDFQHGNNKPELFGEKRMEAPTGLLPPDGRGLPANLPASERKAEGDKYVEWYRLRAKQLQAMNRDNSVLEDGGAVLLGREDHVIGKYLKLYRGDLTSEAYMVSVSHTFQPLVTWTTTVQFERGTGFLERNKMKQSPYLAEGRAGPYS